MLTFISSSMLASADHIDDTTARDAVHVDTLRSVEESVVRLADVPADRLHVEIH